MAHSYQFVAQRDGGGILRRRIAHPLDGGMAYQFTMQRDGADLLRPVLVTPMLDGVALDPALGAGTVPTHPYAPGRDRFGRPSPR